ncbi:MAG: complex I NDUFA9 subunit family protein [Pseudomonadota bacterium]|nr:complex I NDUFA9 subunit family protein [Pseudomonadota bacterium]
MTQTDAPGLVTVFGGSGFVGRHVVRELAARGYRVRVAVRRPDLAFHLQPLGSVGQIKAVQANLRYRWSVDRACQGASHVINLVGILKEGGRQRFETVQTFGARAVAEAARAAGARLVHMSALGADPQAASAYGRTKAQGEAAVFETLGDAVVLRPSIIFGPEDHFFNRFAEMARLSPFLPLIGGGRTRFQPVFVGDVADAIAQAVDGRVAGGKVYELGGPDVASFRELMTSMLRQIDRNRLLVPVPWFLAKAMARATGWIPGAPLTLDQVVMLQSDNVVSDAAQGEQRTLSGLGITPCSMAVVLPSYLWRFRPQGQFTRKGAT